MLGSLCKGQMTSSSKHSAFGHEAQSVVFPMPRDAPPQCELEKVRDSQQSRLRVAIGQWQGVAGSSIFIVFIQPHLGLLACGSGA